MAARATLNVSGTRFEMYQSTWLTIKDGVPKSHRHAIYEHGDEFFVEKHAGAFEAVMNYYETGELHLPSGLCPSVFKRELDFWGIAPNQLEKCCFTRYMGYFDDQNVLKILEEEETRNVQQRQILRKMLAQGGWSGVQSRVWLILEESTYSVASKIYFVASAIIIIMSLFSLVAGTHPYFSRDMGIDEWKTYLQDDYSSYRHHFESMTSESSTSQSRPDLPDIVGRQHFLDIIEMTCLPLFAIDLIVRLIFCPFRKQLLMSFLSWVDIVSLVVTCTKYLVEAVDPKEKYESSVVDILHSLQIVRVFRLFRLVKNFTGFRVLVYAFRSSCKDLCLMMMFISVAMLFFSAFVHFSGDDNFPSIPDAFWWAIITMTTVGYGDVVPQRGLSKLIGAICALTGVCLLAVIIPIFVNNFMLFYSYSKIWEKKDAFEKHRSNSLFPVQDEQ